MKQWVMTMVLLAAVGAGNEASAQTCVGTAPVNGSMPLQFGLGTAFSTGVNQFSAGFGGGNERIVGNVAVGINRYGDIDASSVSLAGSLMTQIAADETRRVVVCPKADFGYEAGPKNLLDTGIDVSFLSSMGGVAIGVIAYEAEALSLVPSLEFLVGTGVARASYEGESESASDTFGIVTLAIGLVLERNGTIQPMVAFPLGLEDSSATFGISYIFSF